MTDDSEELKMSGSLIVSRRQIHDETSTEFPQLREEKEKWEEVTEETKNGS